MTRPSPAPGSVTRPAASESTAAVRAQDDATPLARLDQWDEFVKDRVYPEKASKARNDYRNFDSPERSGVREFYRLNHRHQTLEFVLERKQRFLPLRTRSMTIWEALEFLNTLVDDSDPDIELSQFEHLLQTSEAIRADGHEDWFVLVGLLHDLGKVLCLFGEPQWAVVGDTYPVGCCFSERIVYHEFFAENGDGSVEQLKSPCGIYSPGCGLRSVHLSWGHDEYLYHVLRDYLPEPALYMIRFHSFYAWHREGEYDHLADDHDREMLPWVRMFNPYDLYSKCPEPPKWSDVRPYYEELMHKYVPGRIWF